MTRAPDPAGKIATLDALVRERARLRRGGLTLVWTNGCFDLFHAGHASALAGAAALGDRLVVGLNGDDSVRALKGLGRPFLPAGERAALLAALACVDYVLPFDGMRCDKELAALAPDVYAKSGDYTPETLDPGERRAVEAGGGRIAILPYVAGLSTTGLATRICRLDPERVVTAAFGMIRNDRGEMLLVANRYPEGDKWGLPGGGQRRDEPLERTAVREVREETGLDARVTGYAGALERVDPPSNRHYLLHIFTLDAGPRPEPRVQPGENVVAFAWVDGEALARHPGTVLGRVQWRRYLADPAAWPAYQVMGPGEE